MQIKFAKTQWSKIGTRSRIRVVIGAVLAGVLTGCVGYVEPRYQDTRYAPPQPVYVQPELVQDDYVYYPSHQVYYSGRSRQYVYLEGRSWVSRPTPPHITAEVLFASPSVRVDFRGSPAPYHARYVERYPRNWTPPNWQQRRQERPDERRERR